MSYHNPTIDLTTIRTNDNGDFIFDITVIENKTSQKHDGYIEIYYTKENVESLISGYCNTFDLTESVVREFLEEIHKVGRDAWIEKHKPKDLELDDRFSFHNLMTSNSDMVWELKIYKE